MQTCIWAYICWFIYNFTFRLIDYDLLNFKLDSISFRSLTLSFKKIQDNNKYDTINVNEVTSIAVRDDKLKNIDTVANTYESKATINIGIKSLICFDNL